MSGRGGPPGAKARVLVVDDEPIVREVLARYLKRDGYTVAAAADGDAALAAYESRRPDLLILDLMLPGLDGLEVFRRVRAESQTPVIMLTARGEETDRIVGLEMGADDYVSKPFSPREIVARVGAVLRRSEAEDGSPTDRLLRFDGIAIDPVAREVTADGRAIPLTPREFDLLHFLASHPRTVFSRDELLDAVWDVAFRGDPSTVTVHVRRLREKLEPEPSRPCRLRTIRGAGYRFDP